MITSEQAKKLWELVEPVKVGMLVSLDEEKMQARPMHLVQNEFDGSFYFFTEVNTEKVFEIKSDNEVCLTFSCPKMQIYVSLNGRGSILKDKVLIDRLWNPFIAAWFPQGKEDSSVCLIKIDVYQAECWQGKNNKAVQLFKYAAAIAMHKKPNIGNYEKLK